MNAIIFDLDGTLLDTLEDIADSCNKVLRDFGYPEHPVEKYRYFVGDGAEKLIRRAASAHLGTKEFSEMYLAYRALYKKQSAVKSAPYAGVTELLTELKQRGLKLAVLSNKPHDTTEIVVRHYFPAGMFDAVKGLRPDCPSKPSPEAVFEILGALGVEPHDCLYVGDTDVDMRTAKNADLVSVGVLWGFRTREELEENGAKHIIARPEELLALL